VTRYRAVREPLPRAPTAFQGSKCVRGGLKRREYQVSARYQVRANALPSTYIEILADVGQRARVVDNRLRTENNMRGCGYINKYIYRCMCVYVYVYLRGVRAYPQCFRRRRVRQLRQRVAMHVCVYVYIHLCAG